MTVRYTFFESTLQLQLLYKISKTNGPVSDIITMSANLITVSVLIRENDMESEVKGFIAQVDASRLRSNFSFHQ